ncbi:glycoside hydrolase family protein [Pantoea sp. MBLJ3]|uniref:glycoside hydrolase family protein n=1 Tax=Pantoea sp. MBLJ3 TaxID=1562889 RepID=UPI0005801320|nr:glycoside hydrolase family protein [Pantoea sp. MBLJ3]
MNLYQMLSYDEGEKLELYKDSEGFWTIGIGRLITKNPSYQEALRILSSYTGEMTGRITQVQSEKFLTEDILRATKSIERSVLNETYNQLNEARRMALVNMVFQLGLSGVLGFKKMIQHLQLGNWSAASAEALDSKWARQTPNRARRVTTVIKTGSLGVYC